jgi:hypothetical protein
VTVIGNVTLTGLVEGGHNIIVFANDTLGIIGASERVYFSVQPLHDVSVINISLPSKNFCSGETIGLNVTVKNKGTVPESFNVSIYYNTTLIEMMNVKELAEGANETLTCYWNTTNGPLGTYLIKAEASQVYGETNVADNILIYGLVTIYPKPLVQIEPSHLEFKVAQDFEIGIWIVNVTNLCHFEFNLYYDPTLLYILDVFFCDEYGMFLKGPYSSGVIYNDAVKGQLYISLTQSKRAVPVSGTGQLAQIKVKISKTIVYSWKPNSTNFLQCNLTLSDFKIGVRFESVRFLEQREGEIVVYEGEYWFRPVPGDLNLDGVTDVLDLCGCAKNFGSVEESFFDVNGDRIVNYNDLILIARNIGRTEP